MRPLGEGSNVERTGLRRLVTSTHVALRPTYVAESVFRGQKQVCKREVRGGAPRRWRKLPRQAYDNVVPYGSIWPKRPECRALDTVYRICGCGGEGCGEMALCSAVWVNGER